jgi:hypothetical protein
MELEQGELNQRADRGLDDQILMFDSQQEKETFLFPTASIAPLGPPSLLFSGYRGEADCSPDEVKYAYSYTSAHRTALRRGT